LNQASGAPVADIAASQFIYVQADNQLFYDDDGTGSVSSPVLLATVIPGDLPANQLLASDFQVV
jgi:hypothetical protein